MNQTFTTLLTGVALAAGIAFGSSSALAGENGRAHYAHWKAATFFRVDAGYSEPQRRAFTWIDIQALRAFTRML